MSLVNKKAPDFTANAVVNGKIQDDFKLSKYLGRYVVLFFYPLDFTFVCPTELHAFEDEMEEFRSRGVDVIAVSTDSCYSHIAWLNTPKVKGGIEGVTYPIVSDFNKIISRDYEVLLEEDGIALRGLFLIDKEGVVQHQVINNLPLGRNVDEVIRMIDALQFSEKYGEVCPANWNKGEKAMTADEKGLEEFFAVSG